MSALSAKLIRYVTRTESTNAFVRWTTIRIKGADDLDRAKRIIRLAYENAKRNLDEVKSRRSQSRVIE